MEDRTNGERESLLVGFEALMIDDRHRELTRLALDLAVTRSADPDLGKHAKEAFLSSTFEVFCAPPSATLEESLTSAKFLLIFFKADDASPQLLDEFTPHLNQTDGSDHPGELRGCYDDLMADFQAQGRDSSGFREALGHMCAAMQEEKRANKETMTEAEYRRLRRHTVAVPAYTECWRTIRGITFSPGLAADPRLSEALDLAAELVYIVNDVGSFERDERTAALDPQDVDPNLVHLRARVSGDPESAFREVIDLHNARVTELQRVERALLASEHGQEPALRGYLEILRCTVNGNLATTRHLIPMRYEGAAERLAKLIAL
jgi:hypothetical protein